MGHARYFLTHSGEDWLVTLEGSVMARSRSRMEAIETAIVMADLMGSMHHDADVMAESDAGRPLELVWTYGRDRVPKAHRRAKKQAAPPRARVHLVQRGEARA